MTKVLLIYGPTASGKSSLADELALEHDGEIINADALQVYQQLKILSARGDFPKKKQNKMIQGHLYGHVSPHRLYSVGQWVKEARDAIKAIKARNHLPIIIGGTGLYFRGLTQGLAQLPPIPRQIRARLRLRLDREGQAALYQELLDGDPDFARQIQPADKQRLLRGLEILTATNIPLSQWQKKNNQPSKRLGGDLGAGDGGDGMDLDFIKTILKPSLEVLEVLARLRLDEMLKHQLLEEIAMLKNLNLPFDSAVNKALGFQAFSRHLDGEMSLEEAYDETLRATKHYIRRQLTWSRTQMADWQVFETPQKLKAEIKLLLG